MTETETNTTSRSEPVESMEHNVKERRFHHAADVTKKNRHKKSHAEGEGEKLPNAKQSTQPTTGP
jgi:hypothetical protein